MSEKRCGGGRGGAGRKEEYMWIERILEGEGGEIVQSIPLAAKYPKKLEVIGSCF